ncbi:MAG TPA: MFS transporter [Clostridia bacterium]|nr:MFS transporter [Clostridia bacterium]
MRKTNNILRLKFEMLYFSLFGTMACYYPYLPLYLEDRKLSYTQIGIVFALNSLTGIIAQPIWGYVTDKHLTKKKTLFIASIFCTVLAFNFLAVHSFSYILASIAVLLVFQSITSPMLDAYSYEVIDRTNSFSYGQVRLMGSVGFALVSLALGKVIQLTDITASFIVYSVLFMITAYLVCGIKSEGKSSIKRPSIKDVLDTMKQLKFMIFVFSVLLANIALGANSSYISVLVKETGGNVAILGFVWFVIATSEIPAFFFGSRLQRRFGELNIYLFAVGLYILRFFLCSMEQSYMTVIAIQFMQSVTFPLYLMGAMQYLYKIVPEHIKASGITLLTSLGFGLGSFIGNLYGGMLLESHGIYYLYRTLSIFCILSLIVGIYLKFMDNRTVRNERVYSIE